MTYRLKNLLIAMVAMGAVSAVTTSAAYAVPEFHFHETLTTLTVNEDGTSKTGHQVIDFGDNGGFTCNKMSAHATTSAKTTTQITVENISYSGRGCVWLGDPSAKVFMNGCHYLLTSSGGGIKNSMETGQLHIQCPAGKVIEFTIAGVCTATVSAQTPPGTNQITFHNIGTTSDNSTQITVEPTVTGISYTVTGAGCVKTGAFNNGEYTTGNWLMTGEKHGTSTMSSAWWG